MPLENRSSDMSGHRVREATSLAYDGELPRARGAAPFAAHLCYAPRRSAMAYNEKRLPT
jgi:hypothetical protein